MIIPAAITPMHAGEASREARRELVSYVNADPTQISLGLDGVEAGPSTSCDEPGGGVHIAYSARCVLRLPANIAPGVHSLTLRIRERFKTVPTRFDVLLVK